MKLKDKLNKWVDKAIKWLEKQLYGSQTESEPEQPTQPVSTPDETTTQPTTPTTPATGDAVSYDSLDFCWGGFKKKGAVTCALIKNLSVKSSGMSYSWASGGCENLGASSGTDAGKTVACLFCKIDGKWKGGKFDWISTSRKTRDFSNISGGYNGWDKQAISKASEYAFVIVSTVKNSRTNVIHCNKTFKAQSTTSEVLGILKQLLSFFVSRSDRKIKKQDDIMDKIDNLKRLQRIALRDGRVSDAASLAKEIEQLYKKFNKVGLFSCIAFLCLMMGCAGCKTTEVKPTYNSPVVLGERVRIVDPGKTIEIPQLQPPARKWYLVDDIGLCQWLNIPIEEQP